MVASINEQLGTNLISQLGGTQTSSSSSIDGWQFFFKNVYLKLFFILKIFFVEIKREKIDLALKSELGGNFSGYGMESKAAKQQQQHQTAFDYALLNGQQSSGGNAANTDLNNINYSNQLQQSYLSNQQYAYNSYKM